MAEINYSIKAYNLEVVSAALIEEPQKRKILAIDLLFFSKIIASESLLNILQLTNIDNCPQLQLLFLYKLNHAVNIKIALYILIFDLFSDVVMVSIPT